MDKRKGKSKAYPHLMGSPIDPSGMAAHQMPDATDPYGGGTLAIPGSVPAGLTSAYQPQEG